MSLVNPWVAGHQLYAEGRYAEALEQFAPLRADEHDLDPASLALAVARCLHSMRRVDEAEPWFDRALAPDPDRTDARWEYAMQCLLLGRFTPGWSHYEQRRALYGADALHIYPFEAPLWQGEPLEGKTILIHGEQGFGDEIMFASMVADVVARAARCVLACSPALHSLFERSFPGAIVVPLNRGDPASWRGGNQLPWLRLIEPIDYQIPCGSLARILRPEATSFPRRAYLRAHEPQVATWKRRLDAQRDPEDRWLVGVAWAGNRATGLMGARKSVPIEMLRPLAQIPGVRLVSLHMPDHAHEAATVPDMRVIDFSANLRDFDDTAALMSACDLVVSVDTSVAHLAGALGLRTLLPLWHGADWRWGRTDRDAWWYPDVRIARQQVPGEWAPVVYALADHVREHLGIPAATAPAPLPTPASPCLTEPEAAEAHRPLLDNVLLPTEHGFMVIGREALLDSGSTADELHVIGVLREVMRYLPPQPVVLDIGAGIGTHTLEFARGTHAFGGEVHAFESQRRVFYMLAGNVAINSHFNVRCHHAALGSEGFERSIDPSHRAGEECAAQITLDSLSLPRVDLVRLAMAGHETLALQGGRDLLRRCMPVICVDCTASGPYLRQLLFEFGYRVFQLAPTHFICVHRDRPIVGFPGLQEVFSG